MSEKDLRDKVLYTIYETSAKGVSIVDFCRQNKLTFKDEDQQSRVFKALRDSQYITAEFFIKGGVILGITPTGVDYVEKNLREPIIVTANGKTLTANGDTIIAGHTFRSSPQSRMNDDYNPKHYFKLAKEEKISIKTKSVPQCFNVGFLAYKFADHIDDMNCEDNQMIGIFGSWGRGKTYFWEIVKTSLKKKDKYTFVEFNAWKYQETPALWAYLYSTFQKEITSNWLSKLWCNIIQNKSKVIRDLVILIIFILFVFILPYFIDDMPRCVQNALYFVAVVFFFSKEILTHLSSVVESLKKTMRGKDYSHHLGCKSEIESSLVTLLKYHISDKEINKDKTNHKKVILFIDDIDRSNESEMISIIDSLRTILENSEISKRLIIVCAVDELKLSLVLSKKYELLFEDELSKVHAREQMDKIFISGIKLRPICLEEQIEFIKKLIDIKGDEGSESINIETTPTEQESPVPLAEEISEVDEKEKQNRLSLFEKMLNDPEIKGNRITPRQLRIIYYRYLLANNLLSGSVIPKEEIAKSIYWRTLDKDDKTSLDTIYKNAVDSVVCY